MTTSPSIGPRLLAATALAALAASPAAAGQAGWEELPLPELCRPATRAPRPPALADGRHLQLFRQEGWEPGASESALPVQLLQQMLERSTRASGASLEVYRGAPPLLARGEPQAVAELRARLLDLERVSRVLDVDLRVGLVPAGAPEAGRVHERRVRSGGTVQLGERAGRAFVAGWDVEVAADSGVAAPSIGRALTGETVHLTAYRVDQGRAVHVDGLLDLAQLAAIEDFDPHTRDFGVIQQPLLRAAQVAFSGRIAPGERLTVELRGLPLETPDWTLWVEATTAPDVADARAWALLDLAFVAARVAPLPPVRPGAGVDDWVPAEIGATALEPLPAAAVATSVDATRSFSKGTAPLHWTGSLLFVPADDEGALREARSFVAAAERASRATTTVEVRLGDAQVTLPTTAGRPARVLVGSERTWLVDYRVQIAPETWMAEPVTELAFDGTCVDLLPGTADLACGAWTASTGSPGELSADRALLGRLQLPERTFRGHSTRLGPDRGSATLLTSGADGDVSLRIVQ